MSDERIDLLAGVRRSLYVVTSATGRRQVRGDLTRAEREALRDAIDAELAALRSRFAFDPRTDVERPLDLMALVRCDNGAEIIVDPLNLLAHLCGNNGLTAQEGGS